MIESKTKGTPLRVDVLDELLDQPLEDEVAILEALTAALAKGQPHAELWLKLHESATRDDRGMELAFAYEKVLGDRRMKLFPTAAQAAAFMHAARYFIDVVGDADGARGHLEKAFALQPGNADVAELLEDVLVQLGDRAGLSQLLASLATHKQDPGEQLDLLRRAMKLLDGIEGQDERAIKIGLAILKLEPGHPATVAALELRLGNAGKWAELARLLEQSLASSKGSDAPAAGNVAAHRRLVEIYATRTNEIERATSHVEVVLEHEPADELAVSVAEKLLTSRASAGRAAGALEKAYEAVDDDAGVARMLALQLDQNRGGPKRLEVQKRLAALHANRLADPAAAWPILEQVVIADPGDGAMRKLLRQTADLLGKQPDAAKLLQRAASLAKDPLAKALVTVEAARLVAALGDSKRAAQQIAQVLEGSADPTAQLEAARALADLPEGVSAGQLATALEKIADGAEQADERHEAAERLATVAEYELEDLARAIEAWRRLLDAGEERGPVARESLERLFEATERHAELVASLQARAADEEDELASRALSLRAARVLADRAGDAEAAAIILRELEQRHGPARDLHDQLLPLLLALGAHAELAVVLEHEIELATDPERPDLLVELGRVRLAELGDLPASLEAHRRAIEIEPAHVAARESLEAMLDTDIGLDAAVVLEPIYRRFGDDAGLARALETRLAASVHREERASLLADLVGLCEATEPGRALGFASAALGLDLERRPVDEAGVDRWLSAAERIAGAGPGPGALAAELASSLGEGPFAGAAAARVARRAAEANETAGRTDAAVAMARRAVAAAPEDAEGEVLLDRLLAGRGDAAGRLAAREEAVVRAGVGGRRRDALLRLAAVAEETGASPRAAEVYERVWSEHDGDPVAIEGLVRVYDASADWERLGGALERARALALDEDGRRRVDRRLADARVKAGRLDEAVELYLDLVANDADLPDAALGAAFALAARAIRPELSAAVLERRVLRAPDDAEASRHAEALGELLRDQVADPARAAAAFRTAARAAQGDDQGRAEAMWSRVLAVAPEDREAAERLTELRASLGDWTGALDATELLLRLCADDEAVRILLGMELAAARAESVDRFLAAAASTLERPGVLARAELGFVVLLARARALVAMPDRDDEAAAELRRAIVQAPGAETRAHAVGELGRFLETKLGDSRRWDDARAWFEATVDLSEGEPRRDALMAWARSEAQSFGDLARAIALADRVVSEFPDEREARSLRAEWLLATGDVERGVEALLELRAEAEGDARATFERRAAALLLGRGKAAEAVALLEARLDDDPTDGEALALALHAAATPEAADAAGALVERVSQGLDPERRAQQLEALLAAAPESPRRRAWLEDLLGCVEGERAAQVAVRLAEEAPEEDELWDGAERRARALSRPEGVAAAYRRALDAIAARAAGDHPVDVDAVERLGRRAVDWQEEWFDDQAAAGALLLATLRAAPAALWAFERLKLAYNAAERWDDLFDLYDLVLERTADPHERIMLLDDAAQTARDFAQDGDRAILYLEQLAKLRPDDGRVAASLERLYERYGRWRDLVAMLWGRLDALGGSEGAKLAGRIAGMWLDGAKDGEQALVAIERMESLHADGAEVLPLLERVAALGSETSETSPRQRAAARLESRYRDGGRPADLARALEIRLEAAAGAARARRLRELVALRRDVLGDDDGAATGLIELVRLEPSEPGHRAALVAIAERTGRWDRLAEALETIAAESTEVDRLALLADAARLQEERAGAPERAIVLWRTILDEASALGEPTLEEARLAAERLDALLEASGDARERCDVLERRATLEPSRALRAAALQEASRVAQVELGDLGRAVDLARKRIQIAGAGDPLALGAVDVVVDGLRALGRWEELVAALAMRAEVARTPALARADRVDAAGVLARELGRPADAIVAWKGIEDAEGRDDEIAEALLALYVASGREADLAALLEDEAARATDPRRAAELLVRLGDLRRTQGGYEDALASYRMALETDPSCALAADGLRALVSAPTLDRTVLRDVVGALETSYATAEAWEALVALASARLGVAEDDAARVVVLLETAKVLETRLADVPGAAGRVAEALVLDPTRVATADELLRLCRAADDFDAAAGVLASGEVRLLAAVADATAVELLRGAANSTAQRGDDAAAERFVLSALSRAPADVDLMERLVRSRRTAAGSPLVDALERLAMATSRLDVLREAVEAARDARDPRARALTRSMLDLAGARWTAAPEDEGASEVATWAFEVLVELARDAGDDADVRAAHVRAAELPFPADRKRELALLAAGLAPDAEAAAILGALATADPTDDEVATALDEVLRRLGRRAELRALWTRRADAATDAAKGVAHRRELAELALEDGDEAVAVATLRRNIEEAADSESFSRLVEILSVAARFPDLCGLLEEHAARIAKRGDAPRAAKLWERAAEVAELHLRALERAIGSREKSLGLADTRGGREALVRLLEQRGHWARAARSLELLLEDSLADEADALTVRLADALARAGDVARAQQILEAAAVGAPPGSPLRARLLAFYRQADLPRPLAELLRDSAEAALDPAEQVALLREAAALHIQRLDDASGALPLLARAAELDPEDQGTRLVLAEALRAAGRLEEAAGILEALVGRYGNRRPKERAVVHHELSKLALSLGDRAKALEELDQAAKIDPAHPEILYALATLALEEGQLLRAQRTFRGLLFVLKPGRPGDPRPTRGPSRSEVLFELAEIEAKNRDVARQSEMMESAFEAAEADPWEAERLLGRLRGAGRGDLMARALQARLAADLDPSVAAPLVAELAETQSRQGDGMGAVEAALRAASLAARDEAVHRRVAAVLRTHDALDRYRAMLDAIVEAAAASELDSILFAARALERELGDDAGAAAALRRADDVLDGEDLSEDNALRRLAISRRLESIALRAADAGALIELLDRRLEPPLDAVVDPAERIATLRRVLALRLAAGADDDAVASLCERLVEAASDADAVDADLRQASDARPTSSRLARLLEDFGRERDRPGTLSDALVRQAAIEPTAAPDLLREAWDVAREAGDDARTLKVLEISVAAAPGVSDAAGEARFAWALSALAERCRAEGDLARAADLWERVASVAEGDEERELILRVARTAEQDLGDRRRAALLYERLREREPGDRAVWGPLAGCWRALGEHDALVRLLEDTLPLVDDRDARNELREELARLLRASDPARSAALLEEVLDEDPARWEAAAELETMLSAPERRADLAAFLARRLDAARDAEDKGRVVDIAQRLGKLHQDLGEEQEAATAYHAGLEWEPEHRGILRALVELAEKRDDQMELTDALENLLRVESGPGAVQVARHLAAVRDAQGDEPGAHASLLTALRAVPDDRALFTELKARFETRGDARALAEVLSIAGQGAGDPAERKTSLLEAAAALRDKAGDAHASVELLGQAFDIDPADRDVLFQLMDARSALGQHARAIEAVEKAMAADADGDPWLFFSRAVLREGLGDGERALEDLQTAYDRSEGQYAAELDAQIRTCLMRADDAGDAVAGRAHRLRLARLQLAQSDVEGAAATLEDALRQGGRDIESLRLSADLLERLGRWAEAADSWRQLFTLEEGEDLHQAALRFADAAVRADRPDEARVALERALTLQPQSRPIRERLRALYERLGDRLPLAQLELIEAGQLTDPGQRAVCLVRGGRILLELGRPPEEALAAAEQAAQLAPGDQDVAMLHAEALARLGRRAEAAAVLEHALQAHKGRRSPKLALIHRTMGRLAFEDGEPARALEAFGKAFDSDPQNATLALELGSIAVQLSELEIAGRAYRSVTLMRAAAPAGARASMPPPGSAGRSAAVMEGASGQDKSVAYYQLGCIAYAQHDLRRAKMMLEKALDEDPTFGPARDMLGGL